ncbi:MAG: glutamate synthase domain 1, partial [halophilic archaeon J07HB67]
MTDTHAGDDTRDGGQGVVGGGDGRGTSDGTTGDRVGDGDGLADPTETRANCGVGGVVDLEGGPSHETVTDALTLLADMEHRGARGADPNTGDGAGVMIERPDGLFEAVVDHDLPETYAVGSFFFPPSGVESAKETIEGTLATHDCTVVGWRAVPTDADGAELGPTARAAEPAVWQAFVAPAGDADPERFDRDLYVGRRAVESAFEADDSDTTEDRTPYVVSLDRERVVYKGLLTAPQLRDYYPDLRDDRLRSRVALVHARFSTNTLGAWHLAHPYRNVVHNGEFNTVDGNISWMQAREADLADGGFTDEELATVTPVVSDPDQSDTATVDEVLDLLLHGGRELPHALRMLVPEAYRGDPEMSEARRDFYDFHASLV